MRESFIKHVPVRNQVMKLNAPRKGSFSLGFPPVALFFCGRVEKLGKISYSRIRNMIRGKSDAAGKAEDRHGFKGT